jgi:hypothetical protein
MILSSLFNYLNLETHPQLRISPNAINKIQAHLIFRMLRLHYLGEEVCQSTLLCKRVIENLDRLVSCMLSVESLLLLILLV